MVFGVLQACDKIVSPRGVTQDIGGQKTTIGQSVSLLVNQVDQSVSKSAGQSS